MGSAPKTSAIPMVGKMARRSIKAEGALIVLAIMIGLPIYLVSRVFEMIGWMTPVAIMIAAVLMVWFYKYSQKQKRLAYLRAKYNDEDVVQKIYAGHVWQGQSEEQLRDSLGKPNAIDNKLLKTMTREIWKYHPSGINRYRLRITVDNGRVAGWDQKA